MATAVVLNEVLQASPEKDNLVRLSRLVNGAGTKIVKGLFDSKIPPRDLAIKLNDPQVLVTLRKLKGKVLNNCEWDKLFPSSALESKSFDLTLLMKLLTEKDICGITRPTNGWNNLPSQADITVADDIARLRWYRNTFAHTSTMEIEGDDFDDQWDDIKGALLRILGTYSGSSTVTQCEKEIDNFRTAPLSHSDLERVRESLACCSELLVHCTTKLASTGAEWIKGGAYIVKNGISGILGYFTHIPGVEPINVTEGSVKIVLWVTSTSALDILWQRYQSGKLSKELERILLTDELRQLAKGDEVKLEVFVSEEKYQRAQKELQAKEEEKGEELAEAFQAKMSIKSKASPKLELFEGDIVEDGENKWQAHLAVITSKDQAEEVLTELKKKDRDVAEATHNIWAYRIFNEERNAYDEHCEDDGDDTSGARVLRFLQRAQAADVMVVVSCWYETTAEEFGDVRFKCIKKSVLDLLLTYGIVQIPPSIIKKFYEEIKYTPLEREKEQGTPKFDILHGEPIEDRKSTFQAHLADITSRGQVDQVLDELKKDRKIAKATYNMWACRVYDKKTKTYTEEGYDDGENQGGERLLHLLQRSDAKDVVVIVTRWHGGIHLGNDRFKHINKCASDLLQQRSKRKEETTSTDPKEATRKKTRKSKKP